MQSFIDPQLKVCYNLREHWKKIGPLRPELIWHIKLISPHSRFEGKKHPLKEKKTILEKITTFCNYYSSWKVVYQTKCPIFYMSKSIQAHNDSEN